MYKTRNTGKGNGIQGMRVMGILHSRECPQTFQEISPNIPGKKCIIGSSGSLWAGPNNQDYSNHKNKKNTLKST